MALILESYQYFKIIKITMFHLDFFAMISSCKELWEVIDTKEDPFKWSSWEGLILSAIQYYYFNNNSIRVDQTSFFKHPTKQTDIIKFVNKFIPNNLQNSNNNRTDGEVLFKFDISCMKRLFNGNEYNSSVIVASTIEDCIHRIIYNELDNMRITIIVNKYPPTTEDILVNNKHYDLRFLCVVKSKDVPTYSNNFDAIRCMRHGNGFNSW